MSSKYDSITTAADLVKEVMAHGLSTVQDDLNRAADIFGRSSIEELVNLANDIGRNNENGEPDPKGSWSSGRKATQSTILAAPRGFHASPRGIFTVRGHYRHYKSGKVVWVSEYKKGTGKKKKKTYKMGGKET